MEVFIYVKTFWNIYNHAYNIYFLLLIAILQRIISALVLNN